MDYEALRFIWWVLIGVLLIGFVVTDGFDMGVASLLKVIGRNNEERRLMINTVAPHWDGNQVWLITAAGALFAAWPTVYAAAFSGFYLAMMLTLFALFLRPIAFEYRSKIDNQPWRDRWDWALTVGSTVPPLIIGVAFGNLLQGVPFHFDELLRIHYTGNFWGLLNPFALLVGVFTVIMFVNHGATWLQMKTEGALLRRAENVSTLLGLVAAVLFVLAGIWLWFAVDGFHVTGGLDTQADSTIIGKQVEQISHGWFLNYQRWPLAWLLPLATIAGFAGSALLSKLRRHALAFVSSALAIAGTIVTFGLSMFPFIMPSSINPNHSLTLWDGTASELTLLIMLVVVLIFVPLILGYTAWGYYVMRGRVSAQHIRDNSHSLY